MASVFWNARWIIFIDHFQRGKAINGEYYANLLQHLSDEIKKKRPHLAKKKVLFHQKTMHQFKHPLSRWPKSMSYSSNYFFKHPIRQIEPPQIIYSFQNWRKVLVVKDLPIMTRRSLRLMAILRSSMILTVSRVSKLLHITGKSVSS